jgi:transposase
VPPDACRLSPVRPVWRLENGRAVLVAYRIYRGPGNRYGQIPGVLGRSEYGLEIVTEIAYLVYIVGLSFDKVCHLLNFFQNLRLRKSQANTLLYQLSRDWEREFDLLCTLLANSLVVHADETRWSLNSVWAFLSEKARVLLFGVHKDAGTLQKVLDPASFAGILISDDAAVYANFTQAQKCWAHLLRKAIKLTLQDPNNAAYRTFTDRLLEIYREACRVQRDGRLSDAGRAKKVLVLDDEILDLCVANWLPAQPPSNGLEKDYRLLVNEVLRLLVRQELLTFVTAKPTEQPDGTTKPVDGTNNEAERTLRGAAQARLTGRTSKTLDGARRQTILTSVLQSLRLYLPTFTLSSVLAELKRWWATGRSCFAELMEQLKLTPPEQSVIDQILPGPSG